MTKKKKLVIFSYDFPPSNGGIARLCNEIAQEFSLYYDDIEVVTRGVKGPSKPYNLNNLKIIRFGHKRGYLEYKILMYLRTFDKKAVDIICGVWHPEAIIAKLAGFKNIYVLGHGTEFLDANIWWRRNIWQNIYCKFILESITCLITNSNYTKKLAKNISNKASVRAIPLGVNSDFFKPCFESETNHDKINIVSLSRIFKFKGYDFIAKTIASLPNKYKSKVCWNIGGTGPYLNDLKVLVDELGIKENTVFHHFVPDEKLPEFYSKNDLFILCTRESENTTDVEGFGLVFIEAQSCGIPVIGTNTGGIPDAIEHENGGWLINQDDEHELSELLIKLVDDVELLKQQGSKARQRILNTSSISIYCNRINLLINE